MQQITEQMQQWSGEFGQEYTRRNSLSAIEMDAFYQKTYGLTRTQMNGSFLSDIPRNGRILEVGCNIGCQLEILQGMGFTQLYGIELQSGAVEIAKQRVPKINVIQGSAFDIPFRDGFFDLVFTSGVLIHIAPSDRSQVMAEVYRCTQNYIWGFEYWSPVSTEVIYRGHNQLLWKANFVSLYKEQFGSLKILKEQHYSYLENSNQDSMFLLQKEV